MRTNRKSHAKTQRRKGSDEERVAVWTCRLFGWSGKWKRLSLPRGRELKVVNDSVDAIFQKILTEVDQEAEPKPGKPEVGQELFEVDGFQLLN